MLIADRDRNLCWEFKRGANEVNAVGSEVLDIDMGKETEVAQEKAINILFLNVFKHLFYHMVSQDGS